MHTTDVETGPTTPSGGPSRPAGEMVELSLLVPEWQLAQLEQHAQSQGLTTGQMLRRLISAYLHEPA